MNIPPDVVEFWNAFAAATGRAEVERFYESFVFGDSEVLANELAELVLAGIKRATAGAVWSYASKGQRLPVPGDLSIVTNWAGTPLCVIETTCVELVPFDQVSAEFAATEGEGDGSLEYWRESHRAYFTRECEAAGRVFDETLLIACEKFEVLYQDPGVDSSQKTD